MNIDDPKPPQPFVGVAPEVTYGVYRVFGCGGGTPDDVIMAALERAAVEKDGTLSDGCDTEVYKKFNVKGKIVLVIGEYSRCPIGRGENAKNAGAAAMLVQAVSKDSILLMALLTSTWARSSTGLVTNCSPSGRRLLMPLSNGASLPRTSWLKVVECLPTSLPSVLMEIFARNPISWLLEA